MAFGFGGVGHIVRVSSWPDMIRPTSATIGDVAVRALDGRVKPGQDEMRETLPFAFFAAALPVKAKAGRAATARRTQLG